MTHDVLVGNDTSPSGLRAVRNAAPSGRRPRPGPHLHDGIPSRLSLSSGRRIILLPSQTSGSHSQVKHPLLAAVWLGYPPTGRQVVGGERRPGGRVRPALGRSCGGSRAQPDTLVAVGTEWVVELIVEFVLCQLNLAPV